MGGRLKNNPRRKVTSSRISRSKSATEKKGPEEINIEEDGHESDEESDKIGDMKCTGDDDDYDAGNMKNEIHEIDTTDCNNDIYISKGVFAHPVENCSPTRSHDLAQSFFHGNEDCKTNPSKRFEVYCSEWNKIEKKVKQLQCDISSEMFQGVTNFIKATLDQKSHIGNESTMASALGNEVPTAVLVTGVNMPDHAATFLSLANSLENNFGKHIAILRSSRSTNLKSMISSMNMQLIGEANENDEEMDTDKEETDESEQFDIKSLAKSSKTTFASMQVLEGWYASYIIKSPNKRNLIHPEHPNMSCINTFPLIVVLEDLEGFHPMVLSDFITILSNYMSKLPLVLVCGVATSVSVLHQIFSKSVLARMSISTFTCELSTNYLSMLLESLVFTADVPFKLGAGVFQLLKDIFLYHDFSVHNFMKSFKLCMQEHFWNHDASILCCSKECIDKLLSALSDKDVKALMKMFPSIVTGNSVGSFKEALDIELRKMFKYHDAFFTALHCLHTVCVDLPSQPLGSRLREVYQYLLSMTGNELNQISFSLHVNQILYKRISLDDL